VDDGGVTDETAIHLSATDRQYLSIALDKLATAYEKSNLSAHAEGARHLAIRVERTPVAREGVPPEEYQAKAKAVLDATETGERAVFDRAVADLYELAMRYEPDPQGWLSNTIPQLLGDAQRKAAQNVAFMVHTKLSELTKDEAITDPHAIFQGLNEFLITGRKFLDQGGDLAALWSDDPHLLRFIERARNENKV